MIVQIEEALIGRRKYQKGRVVQGTWVLGMIAENGSVRFYVVPNRKRETLEAIILSMLSAVQSYTQTSGDHTAGSAH